MTNKRFKYAPGNNVQLLNQLPTRQSWISDSSAAL